jgi:hypothetical protein
MLKQTFGEGFDDRAATLSNPWPRGPKHIYHVMGRRAGSRTRPRAGTTPRESARSPRRSAAGSARRPGPPAAGLPPGRTRERAGLGSCVVCGAISCALRMIFVSYPGIVDTGGCECDRPDASVSVSVTHRSVSESPGCIPSACGTSGAAMRVRLKVAG